MGGINSKWRVTLHFLSGVSHRKIEQLYNKPSSDFNDDSQNQRSQVTDASV